MHATCCFKNKIIKGYEMTLIAAFKAHHTPVIIGDFLITKKNAHSSRKKIIKLSDNVAIGWTGDLLAANEIMPLIYGKTPKSRISKEELERILTKDITIDCGKLCINIIGWIVDEGNNYCFRWNSAYPCEVYYDESMLDGRGAEFAKTVITEHNIKIEDQELSQDEAMKFALISTCGKFMNTEIFEQSLQEKFSCGISYEALFLNKNGVFEYLDNILYLGITCNFDENKNYIRAELSEIYFKYETVGRYSAKLSIYNNRTGYKDIHAITAPGVRATLSPGLSPNSILKNHLLSSSFESDLYCIGVKLKSPLYKTEYSLLIDFAKNGKSRHVEAATESGIKLNLSIDELEKLHHLYCSEIDSPQTK
jgi:hypothetical protein